MLQNLGFQQRCRGPFFRFSETLGMDLFEIESPDGSKNVFCNMVCWSTFYHLFFPFLDKTAGTVAKCIAERWIQCFGLPILIIAEQGKEFVGTQFKEFTNANSTLLHLIDVRAPWQNGRTERHGDIYERIFERARWMHSRAVLWRFSTWLWNAMLPRINCPTVQACLFSSQCS